MMTAWRNRKVFVTGATGLVGGWMVRELVDQGAEVIVLVRDEVPRCLFRIEHFDRHVTIVRGELENLPLLRRVILEHEVQAIFHLAAQTLVGVAKANPISTLEANVRGTWNLLDAARLAGTVRAVVAASSDKAYGIPRELPYREDHPLAGAYPYDVSKSCSDLICSMYAATFGLPVAVTRCGNIFGGGDLNFSRLIPGLIRATQFGECFLIRSDGKFIRDYLYVKDAVNAYLILAERLMKSPELKGEAFNFSLETKTTVLDIVGIVLRLMRAEHISPIVLNRTSAEIPEQSLSAEKARRILNWSPCYTLESGLRETIAWYESYAGQRQLPEAAVAIAASIAV